MPNRRLPPRIERSIDIAAACFALLVLSIPLALIAVAIKLESRGPVFYQQPRAGKDGKPFSMVKFRTMVDGAEHMGLGFEIGQNDSRITKVGNLLRIWSVDEFPQLFNILSGEMSLVGPRPARVDQIEMFSDDEKRRMLVKPGLTGWAQVNGRNLITWQERIQLDLWYVGHESFWLNLKILFKTIWVAFIARSGQTGPEGVTRDYGA
ncbi:MAG: sugar transferase [Chloroflexi bacterium]|nr:sugar transferase [Chloroflexota bacterium]MDA1219525.1 sugar transferase [Chloroflexota bacterium]